LSQVRRCSVSDRAPLSCGVVFVGAVGIIHLRHLPDLHSRGLDQFRINCVAATFTVTGFLSEVPTGAFADQLSRRSSFVLGWSLRATTSFAIYIVSPGFGVFLLADAL
jgi:hypothetical protein